MFMASSSPAWLLSHFFSNKNLNNRMLLRCKLNDTDIETLLTRKVKLIDPAVLNLLWFNGQYRIDTDACDTYIE